MPDADRTRTILPTSDATSTPSAGLNPLATVTEAAGQPLEPAPPSQVGRLLVLGEIARGGMGVVYRAHDPLLDREVAIKLLAGTLADRPDSARRFLDEARITGQLQHPSVPPVHETGELPDGRPFLVMKLIKGRTLDDLLKDQPDPAADRGRRLADIERVCPAVADAHDRGVIHRDLKPANVMVGAFGEVQVMDWGLAKVLGEVPTADRPPPDDAGLTAIRTARDSESYTQAGSLLGTPAYMPPEQAAGAVGQIDARADVFGLGAILCTVLTGKPPYTGADGEAVRLKAIQGKVGEAYARLETSGAEPDLVELAKRCLAPEPSDRPADAGEVARAVAGLRAAADERARRAELDRVRAEGDLRAAEARAAEQRKRRKVQAALGLTFTALVLLGGAFVWWTREQERLRAEQAGRELDQAVETAVVRYAQARGADNDLTLWAEARAAALQARDRAVSGGAPAGVRDRVLALLTEIEQVGKNRRLVATLLEIQAGMGDQLAFNNNQNFAGANTRYEQAFRDYGTDLFALTPEAGAELLRSLGGNRTVELAAALDDWAYVQRFAENQKPGREEHLFQVTRRLDPDSTRNRIRDAITAADRDALIAIANEIDPAKQPVQTVNLIPVYLYVFRGEADNSAQIDFLLRAQPHHPGDFQINHNLAWYLNRDRRHEQALPYCLVAIAVRPQSAVAWLDYVSALRGLGRDAEVAAALRRVCTLSPTAGLARLDLARALSRSDDPGALAAWREAVATFREEVRRHPGSASRTQQLRIALTEMARVLRANGELDAAVDNYREAIRHVPSDPTAYSELAEVLKAQGDPEGAAEVLRQFEKILEAKAIDSLCDQVVAHLRAGQADRAVALLPRITEVRKLQPLDTFDLSNALARLGEALVDHGKAAEAEPFLRDCLAIRLTFAPDSWMVGFTRTYLGESLAGQQKLAEAEGFLREGYAALMKATYPAGWQPFIRDRLRTTAGKLADLAESVGKPDEVPKWRAEQAKHPFLAPPPRRSRT